MSEQIDIGAANGSAANASLTIPQASLRDLLLALADDEFVTGYANSEWTGIAPVLEEDIAFSSLAQDELGHARALYELAADVGAGEARSNLSPDPRPLTPDSLAYGRAPEQYRHARLCEQPRGDWAYSVSRQFLYDTADTVRLEALMRSSYGPLARLAARIIREEKYHLLHAHTWLRQLAEGGDEARARQRAAFEALWPDASGLWEPLPGEAALVAAGVLPEPFAALEQRWLARIEEPLRRYGLPWPFAEHGSGWAPLVAPAYGGRRGMHGPAFRALHAEMTSVSRAEPGAQW
jgi:ring-1,2-phenylacetyl-CoA epoxidase subunit PaaC